MKTILIGIVSLIAAAVAFGISPTAEDSSSSLAQAEAAALVGGSCNGTRYPSKCGVHKDDAGKWCPDKRFYIFIQTGSGQNRREINGRFDCNGCGSFKKSVSCDGDVPVGT